MKAIVADRTQIDELLSGESLGEIILRDEPPDIGTVVEIRPTPKGRALCRVTIAEFWPLSGRRKGNVVRCENVEVIAEQVPPRYLARQNGKYHPAQYVTSQDQALPDEPESVPEEWETQFAAVAEQGRVLSAAEQRKAWEDESITTRIEAEIIEAERLGINPGREMARLESGLAALARRNAMAKQQRGKAA